MLIAACNPRIMFYCSLYPPSSSVPYPRPNPSTAGLGILPIKHYFVFSTEFSRQFNTRHKHPAGRSVPLPSPCSHPRHLRQTSHPKAEIAPLSNPVPFSGMDIMKKPILGSFPQLLGSFLPHEPWAELTRHRCSSDEGDSLGMAMLHPRIHGCSCNYGGETNGGFCFSRHAACWGPCRR